ncbi:MAG: glutamyl-tRNA reductase, partial [Bacteroidales bacterium]|nr:glutamyl-tRNA reductase [Bacteroidales bacterium]
IYFSQSIHDSSTALVLVYNCLMAYKKIDFDAQHYFYTYVDEAAASHLFSVCAGIDSMVIGEDQIIGQVKQAYVYCAELALTDAVLMRLFQKSFEAGKRVRSQTSITYGATSVSFVAVDMCLQNIHSPADTTVMLIGTGETGRLALQGFYKKGVRNFIVSNRTPENAQNIVHAYNARFVDFIDFVQHIPTADIVLFAVSTEEYILTYTQLLAIMKDEKSVIFVDLGVPRTIEALISSIQGVRLISVDDLQKIIDKNKEKREACVEQGMLIIQDVVNDFMEWLSFRNLQPAIRAINFHLQKIFRDEYRLFSQQNTEHDCTCINEFSTQLTRKYSQILIKNLKEITDNGRKEQYLKLINNLFRIEK